MAKRYRVPFFVRLSNRFVTVLLRLGLRMGSMALLTVAGRRTGRPRTIPVAVGEGDGRRWIGAPFGAVDWVRNLRAAGSATLTRGGHTTAITVVELTPKEAAVIWKQSLAAAPGFLHRYFAVTPSSSLDEFEREAANHPIFEVRESASR